MMNIHLNNQNRLSQTRNRRGVSLLWMLILFPALMILLCLIVEIGNIWLARLELEHALEATALSAVQEWAENGGGDTMPARTIGNDFAMANAVRDISVDLTDYDANLNYNAANINDNDVCTDIDNMPMFDPTGILVFGAITQIEDAMNPNDPQVIFDAGVEPSCILGNVLVDASSNSNMQNRSSWGFNFDTLNPPNPNLYISSIVIDLLPPGGTDPGMDAFFNVEANMSSESPIISDRIEGGAPDSIYEDMDDTSGLDSTAIVPVLVGPTIFSWANADVTFTWDSTDPAKLTIDFQANVFTPGDRIRFGARIEDLGSGNGSDDGDGIGRENVQASITFNNNGNLTTETVTYVDTNYRNVAANYPADIRPTNVFPPDAYKLPFAPASGNGNDHQSVAQLTGSSNSELYAVRAQTMREVPSICKILCGVPLGPWTISAKSTAYVECDGLDPKLIHIDQFICP